MKYDLGISSLIKTKELSFAVDADSANFVSTLDPVTLDWVIASAFLNRFPVGSGVILHPNQDEFLSWHITGVSAEIVEDGGYWLVNFCKDINLKPGEGIEINE